MSLTRTSKSGVAADASADAVYNLGTQDPTGLLHTAGGLSTANGAVAVGQEFTMVGRLVSAAALTSTTTYTVNFFSQNAPFKFRVLEVQVQLISYTQADWTDGDGGNLDVTLQDGDGDTTSETFTDVLADQALDDSYTAGMALRYPSGTVALVPATSTIDEDESLRAQLVCDPDDTVKGGAGADAVTVDVIVRCLRVA